MGGVEGGWVAQACGGSFENDGGEGEGGVGLGGVGGVQEDV